MKEFAKAFYKSKQWQRCRDGFLKSKLYMCERCKINAATIVHHKIYLTPANIDDANISLNWDNLEALCQDCHNKEHFANSGSYTVNPNGEITPHFLNNHPQ